MTEQPIEPVTAEHAAGLVALDPQTRADIARRAAGFAEQLQALDVRSPHFADRLEELLAVGEADMRTAAGVARTLLDRAVTEHATPRNPITTTLAGLRRTVDGLDPAKLPLTGRKLLGVFPAAGAAKKALDRYRAAHEPVQALVLELRQRQDALRRDNAAVKGERERLWQAMTRLAEAAAFAGAVDAAVERQADVFDLTDPGRARTLRADALHPIRRRHQDLLTQLAVSAQGYLALDLVRRNNDELIRGVERAVTTTMTALRTALVIASALANQRDVLDEVAALRATTDGLIRATTELIGLQGAEIQRASSDPAVAAETIRASFDRIYAALDAVDGHRAEAVRAMAATVESLSGEIRRAEDHLRRSHEGDR
ncbi:toxic anion resistance protein [Saccharothrix syringae]|uniref:Toxic anion resistance protein n=1 Tax=Saccharothrix syringae TaxID=103733 RepID=A0A5Q0H365_SACSY|nr:toxic anion resistance protein [Saccharothrix syringae]QFZ20697.1 toxic anion resistance protein [Saccharothrix syringae]